MRYRWFSLGLVVALLGAFLMVPGAQARSEGKLLKNINVTGTLEGGGTFDGKLTITSFAFDEENQQLLVSGVLKGMAGNRHVTQRFSGVPATLTAGEASGVSAMQVTQQQARCDSLFLDLGPIHLDLLGLNVDLSQIVLDIYAVPGAGNLLGNLLCAVVGILDPGGLIDGLLRDILQQQLDVINRIIGGL